MPRNRNKGIILRNPRKHEELRDAVETEPLITVEKETADCFMLKVKRRERSFPVVVVVNRIGFNARSTNPRITWAAKHADVLLRSVQSDLPRQ